MGKWKNNGIEEIRLTLQPHLNSGPTGPIKAFSELLPLSGNLVSGDQRTLLIQTPQGWRPLNSMWVYRKTIAFNIHNIEHAVHISKQSSESEKN